MKFQKFAALLLAFTVCTATLTACDSAEPSESTSEATTTTTVAQETEETTLATLAPTTESTEATEETEETEESANEDIYGEEGIAKYTYDLYMNYIDELEAQNEGTDMLYAFYDYSGEGDFKFSLLAKPAGTDTFTQYILSNGEIAQGSYISDSILAFTADEIKKLPVLAHLGDTADDNFHIVDSLPDGTYFGNICAFSLDGTKALIEASDPVRIPLTELDGLDKNVEVTDLNGEPIFIPGYGQLITSDGFEYGRNDTMFDNVFWFVRQDDGTAILMGDSDVVVTYNTKYLTIDIAPDCEITDNFLFLYGKADNEAEIDEEANNILKSFYYQCMTDEEYMGKYNDIYGDWSTAYGILEPITVTNGKITSLTFGWR